MRPINQTPQSADGAYERETIINFCDAEKTCSYYIYAKLFADERVAKTCNRASR